MMRKLKMDLKLKHVLNTTQVPISRKCRMQLSQHWFIGKHDHGRWNLPLWSVLRCSVAVPRLQPPKHRGSVRWRTVWTWRAPCSAKRRRPKWIARGVRHWCDPWLFDGEKEDKKRGLVKKLKKTHSKVLH